MTKSLSKIMMIFTAMIFAASVSAQDIADDVEAAAGDAEESVSGYIAGAQSASGNKRLSVGLNLGLKSDMANLGATITKDGTIDIGDDTIANSFYGTSQFFVADRDNQLQKYNSENTASDLSTVADYETGGAMTGLDTGLDVQYDLDDIFGLPLFARTGFNYVFKVGGGSQSRTLGDTLSGGSGAALLTSNGLTDEYSGGVFKSDWNASWMYVPVSIGLNARISEKHIVYFGGGVSWFSGGWSVGLDMDQKYVNAITHYYNSDTSSIDTFSADPVSETIEFKADGIGIHYFIGLESFITDSIAIFGEVNASGYAETAYSGKASDNTIKVFTRATSKGASDQDNQFVKRLAYPVVMGGATVKIGARYYLM